MRLTFTINQKDENAIVEHTREAIELLARGQSFDKPVRHTYITIALYDLKNLSPRSIGVTRFGGNLSEVALVVFAINDDRETGGFFFSELCAGQDDLKRRVEELFWKWWPHYFGDKILEGQKKDG